MCSTKVINITPFKTMNPKVLRVPSHGNDAHVLVTILYSTVIAECEGNINEMNELNRSPP